jgi:hypothetical protein
LGGGLNARFNLELVFDQGNGAVIVTTVPGAADQSQTDSVVRTFVLELSSKQFGTVNVNRQLSGIHGVVAVNLFGGNTMVGDMIYFSWKNSNAIAGRISDTATRFQGAS